MISKLNVESEFLIKTKSDLEKKIEDLKLDINDLNKKNANLHSSYSRFHMRQQKLNNMLETQRVLFDKDGLRYDGSKKEIHFKDFFVKKNHSCESYNICAYYHKLGHFMQFCPLNITPIEANLSRECGFQKELAHLKMRMLY